MKRYAGSAADKREDKKNAAKEHVNLRAYQKSSLDRKKDAEGQKRLNARGKKKR